MSAPADVSPAGPAAGRHGVLLLVSLALLLGMSGWFTATAVAPQLETRWSLGPEQVTLLTTLVQIGFVLGTAAAAVLNLADVLPLGRFFGVSALLAAAANLGLLWVPGFAGAAVLRLLTGVFLAGVYPPAMKMISTWFASARGFAIGTVVGALTLGKATPWLVKAIGGVSVEPVLVATSVGGALGGLAILLLYRDGPHAFARRPFAWSRVGEILRHRPTMLATGGYLGHMIELYAAWAFVPAFLAVALAGRASHTAIDLAGFGMIAAGAAGAVGAGVLADRFGRIRIANAAMWISGGCALVTGWLGAAPAWVLIPLVLVWGLTVVADSAQFSALVTEVAPSHAVGTALTLQTMLGFGLTAIAIEATARMSDTAGWGPAFSLLALGPALGIASMRALARLRGTPAPARAGRPRSGPGGAPTP